MNTTTTDTTNKTYKLYWIFDAAKHNDITTQGYIGCTTQSVNKRFNSHKHDVYSGAKGTSSNTKKHMVNFIANCEDPQVIELCRTKYEDVAAEIERVLRPTPGIGANKHKGGKRNGVQRDIICTKADGTEVGYVSMSKGSIDGFHLGGIKSCLTGASSYTSHPKYGKCSFRYA